MKSYLTLLLAVGTKGLFQDYNPQENQNNLLNNNFKDLNRGVDLNQYFQQLPEDEAKQDLNSAVGRSLEDSETSVKLLTERRRHVADLQTTQTYENFLNSNNDFEELVAPFNNIALNATQAKQAEQRANRIEFVKIVATMAPQIMIDAKEAVNQNNQIAFNATTSETRKILKRSTLLQEQLQCPNLLANLLAFSELTRAEKEKLISGNIAKVDDRFYPRNVFSGQIRAIGNVITITNNDNTYSNDCSSREFLSLTTYDANCLYDLVKDKEDRIDGMPIDKSLANKQNVNSFKTNINQYQKVLTSAKAKQEAEAKAKQEAEAKAKKDAENAEKAKKDAEKAKKEAEIKAKKDVENAEKAKKEAEIKANKVNKIIIGSGVVTIILVALCCCSEKIAKCCADGYNLIDEDRQQNDKEGQGDQEEGDRQERPGNAVLIEDVEMVDLTSLRHNQI